MVMDVVRVLVGGGGVGRREPVPGDSRESGGRHLPGHSRVRRSRWSPSRVDRVYLRHDSLLRSDVSLLLADVSLDLSRRLFRPA